MRRSILRQAAVFHAVANSGSIAGAAARIGKSAPAIHHDLKCLEREMGRPLFTRVGRSLRLTPGARKLHEGIARNLDEIERSLERFARASETVDMLRLAAVSGFARYRLAPRLFARAGADPVELTLGTHDQVIEALADGRAEAGITYKPVTALPIVARRLADEEYVLIGPLEARSVSAFAAVEALSFVTYDEYEYVFAHWFETLFGRQPRRLRRTDHASELEEALESVAAGRGATITPADAWRNGPWRERCRVLQDGPAVRNALYVLRLADGPRDAADIVMEMFST
jgi:DNA-binding transcriptional LysR family regulator